MTVTREIRLLRLGAAAVLAALLTLVVALSSALDRLPELPFSWMRPLGISSWTTASFATILALLALTATAAERPLGAWLGISATVVGFALYEYTNVDWTLVAVDVGLSRGGVPGPLTLVASALPFLVATAFHLLEEELRLVLHYRSKGIDPGEVARARSGARPHAARILLLGAGAWIAFVLAFSVLRAGAPFAVPLARASPVLLPLLVGAALAGAVLYVVRR